MGNNNGADELLKALSQDIGIKEENSSTTASSKNKKSSKNDKKTVTFSSQTYHEKIGLVQKYISEVLLNGYANVKKGEALDYLVNREYDTALEYYRQKGEIDE